MASKRLLVPFLLCLSLAAKAQTPEPRSAGELSRVVEQLHQDHQLDKAAEIATHYLQVHPDDPDALTVLARIQLDRDHLTDAEQLLVRALDISPNSPAANDLSGNLLLGQQRYPEAMDRFETALSINLRDPEARKGELQAATRLALQSRQAGKPDAAYICLQHAREHLPDDPVLLFDLGMQAQEVHQFPTAQTALEAARKLSPDDPKILYALARVELDRQKFPEAERDFRAYLALHPEDPTAHFGLGHLLEMQQRRDEAKSEYARSIQLQPLQTESYYHLGQMALDAGDLEAAAPLFQKTLDRNPKHGGALTGLGIIDYRQKHYGEARQALTAAVASSPEYQPAHYYLGLTLARLGEKADSERELKLATDLERTQNPYSAAAAQRTQDTPPQPNP